MVSDALFDIQGLSKTFEVTKGIRKRRIGSVRAVTEVSFQIRRGEIFGLVGESGCGKTTTGRCLLRAIEPTAGKVLVRFDPEEPPIDILKLNKDRLIAIRRNMRMVFQDPYSSLNPRMNVLDIVTEVLKLDGRRRSRSEIEERAAFILERVGLDPEHMRRYPHAFSGGQRQRIAVARALISEPAFIVADEPVSALDVSIQAQILNLLKALKREFRLTLLFIAHNLAVVQHMCDRIAVMYMGDIVELADKRRLFERPLHPYTEALLSAVPIPNPMIRQRRIPLRGEIGDPLNRPPGCPFHPRCPYSQDRCRTDKPALVDRTTQETSPHLA